MKILVTGGAGFIGSNIVETLLHDDRVSHIRILDNLSTGFIENIEPFLNSPKVEFHEGDMRDYELCRKVCTGIDRITHQAALGSVPRSVKDPITTNAVNITGLLNVYTAAKECGVNRLVYASSSSVYGDSPGLPKIESKIGNPLSPYAVTKLVSEQYAQVFGDLYETDFIGFRYFNVFGPRQSPKGAYAAVIPLFIQALMEGKAPTINGDGSQSRDFTYVDNAVQANIKALFSENKDALNKVYNVALGERTTLKELYQNLQAIFNSDVKAIHGPERAGDIKHSLADISKIQEYLDYQPEVKIKDGLEKTVNWFKEVYQES